MAIPVNREQFKQYCLRRLGAPVVHINADDEQIEDRIDEALKYYADYHFDGTERLLYKHPITTTDQTNKYVTLPERIIGVSNILPIGEAVQTTNLFNIRYQIHLNDLFDISASSFVPYVMARRHIETLEEIFVGQKPFRFNRHTDRLYIDMDWQNDVSPGQYIIIDCYAVLDPDTYTDVWGDRWLAKYATALIKQQWGSNLTKFQSVQLLGGVTLNGDKIKDEADNEIKELETEMLSTYSLPAYDMVG